MRLPTSILSRVRGSVALAALVGCSSPAAAPTPPAPEPVVAVAAVVPDPVAYDGAREAERLARLDDAEVHASSVRAERIDESVALARDERLRAESAAVMEAISGIRQSQIDPSIGPGSIGMSQQQRIWAACGRG